MEEEHLKNLERNSQNDLRAFNLTYKVAPDQTE